MRLASRLSEQRGFPDFAPKSGRRYERDGKRRVVALRYVTSPASARGSVIVKVVPEPTVLCTAT